MILNVRSSWIAVAVLAQMVAPTLAAADRVVLFRPTGDLDEARSAQVDTALETAIRSLNHEVLRESAPVGAPSQAPPETANEMRAIAEVQRATYVVVPRASASATGYRLSMRVGYAPEGRVEELELEIVSSRAPERLRDVVAAMLRPEGVGDDAVRLARVSEEDVRAESANVAQQQSAEERARAEAEERARREREAQERQRALEAQQEAQRAWEQRERYGAPKPWLAQAALGVWPLLSHPDARDGGVIWATRLRLGRSFEGVPGFEVRAGVDFTAGASAGFALYGGAVYLASFFPDVPIFIGGGADLGFYKAFTGSKDASFLVRAAPMVSLRVYGPVFVELALPELLWLSANDGVLGLGGSLGLGIRF